MMSSSRNVAGVAATPQQVDDEAFLSDDVDNRPTASEPPPRPGQAAPEESPGGAAAGRSFSEMLEDFEDEEEDDEMDDEEEEDEDMEPNGSSDDEDDEPSDSDDDTASSSSSAEKDWQHRSREATARQLEGVGKTSAAAAASSGRARKKKSASKFASSATAAANPLIAELMTANKVGLQHAGAEDGGRQFTAHPQFSGLKATSNACSQTTGGGASSNTESAPSPLAGQAGGTTVNDLLLSSSNKNTMASGGGGKSSSSPSLLGRMLDTSSGGRGGGYPPAAMVPSNSQQQPIYCHRSVGVQTLPDFEYPSYLYYDSPVFNGHLIDQSYLKCIKPEDLPNKKQIVHDSSSEGTLRLVIRNFSLLSDTVRGPSKIVHNVPWRIMVMPRQHIVQKKGTQKCLGFFLQCCPDAYSDSWSCQAVAELRLISQKQGIPNFSRKTNHNYSAKENDWGYSCFMTWSDILDENQGYVLNDIVILEVHVKAEPAKNILSLVEFRKKINEYIRVAQMQCERGLIDKAIDCNSQAMKFCKDKDVECLRRLQAQNADLVARKLKQSIARIERGGDAAATEADPAANITALRIAMTGGNAARNATTNRSKRGSKDAKTSTEKRRENEQANNDQVVPADNNDSTENPNQKTDNNSTTNASALAGDKENADANTGNRDAADKCMSACELHTIDCHCNKALTYEQLASIDPNFIKTANIADKTELLKCLEDFAASKTPEAKSKQQQLLCKAIKKHLQSTNASCQTEFPPMPQVVNNVKKERRADKTVGSGGGGAAEKEIDELVRKICNEDTLTPTANEHHAAYIATEAPPLQRESKRILAPVEKKLKLNAASQQKAASKQQQAAQKTETAPPSSRRRGRPATPSGTPPAELYAAAAAAQQQTQPANFKNGGGGGAASQVIRIKKEIDGRFKAFQGVAASKGGSGANARPSRFELIASAAAAAAATTTGAASKDKSGYSAARMQFECERRSFEFLDQHGHKMTPNHFNQFFNQVIKSLPDAGAFGTYVNENCTNMDHIRYRQPFDFDSSNGSPTSCIKSVETDSLKFSAIDEDLRAHGMASFLNLPHPPANIRDIHRRARCSTFPPTATSRLQDIRSYNDEYRETIVRVSLHLYEITNRAAHTIYSLVSFFQDSMTEIFRCGNVSEFPQLINTVVDFCAAHNLDKNLEELRAYRAGISTPGSMSLKGIDHADCMRLVFEGQGDKMLLMHYELYFTQLQNALGVYHLELVPLVKKIIAYANEQKKRADDSAKELDTLRNEQKSWAKEKQQIQKLQKNERTLNQRYETIKQECHQLKSHQKQWQKRESDLNDELNKLRQTVDSLQAKIQERDVQHSRDVQSLHDIKRNHSKELADRQAAVQKLKEQLDEKTSAARKLEQQCAQEKRALQKMSERAKAAEISLVENRVEQAVRAMERSRADADPIIKQIEERLEAGNLTDDESATLKKDLAAMQKYKEDMSRAMEEARTDGAKHMDQIREGKQLSQLPRLNFPKVPALPAHQPIPPLRKPQPPASVAPPPAPQQNQQVQPSQAPQQPGASADIPKVFLGPPHGHQVPPPPPQASGLPSMTMPPPQHSPAASAFRPLSTNPTMMNSSQPPPSFSNQPPPPTPTYMPNGSVHPKMAPYMERTQPSHPNILFTPNNAAPPPHVPPTTPGPIGSRPLSFQTAANNHLVDQLRSNGLDRLNAFVAPPTATEAGSSSTTNPVFNSRQACNTPAELEQMERMRNVRALWEKDGGTPGDANTASARALNPSASSAADKFFQPASSVFGADLTKLPNSNGQLGAGTSDPSAQNITWGVESSIWSFKS